MCEVMFLHHLIVLPLPAFLFTLYVGSSGEGEVWQSHERKHSLKMTCVRKRPFGAKSMDTVVLICFMFGKGPSGCRVWTLSVTHTCGDAKNRELRGFGPGNFPVLFDPRESSDSTRAPGHTSRVVHHRVGKHTATCQQQAYLLERHSPGQ